MANIFTKKQSKRMTCRRRYKIEKKIREHKRKKRRQVNKKERKEASNGLPGLKKLEHVPNQFPFKEELLRKAERVKAQLEQERQRLKEERKRAKAQGNSLDDLVSSASKRRKHFDDLQEKTANEKLIAGLSKPDNFVADLKKIIQLSDVIVEVLDARDPLGSRSSEVEKMVLDAGKRLILVINKIDLIPKENIKKWLSYLRRELPTIAFKASTQEQRGKLGWVTSANVLTSKAIGADLLMNLISNYLRDRQSAIRVGVVGYPNVGKSSIINSLKRKVTCQVGANPGVTRNLQEVQLDKKIRLMDSPGVVLAKNGSMDAAELALKNVIRIERIQDPISVGEAVLRRCSKERLMILYNLTDFNSSDEFFGLLARKMGRLKKGGVPDRKMAARRLVKDWNHGKIRYYCEPPDDGDRVLSSHIVDTMTKEFDIDSFKEDEALVLENLPDNLPADAVITFDDYADDSMDCDDADELTKTDDQLRNRKRSEEDSAASEDASLEAAGNRRDNYLRRQLVKKQKRRMRKTENRCAKLADAMETTMNLQ